MVFSLFLNLSLPEFDDGCISGWMSAPQLQFAGLVISHWQTDRTGQSHLFKTIVMAEVRKYKKNPSKEMKVFFCCLLLVLSVDITETWNVAVDMGQDLSKKSHVGAHLLCSYFHQITREESRRHTQNLKRLQRISEQLDKFEVVWFIDLAWLRCCTWLRGVFTLNHPWCQMILYFTSPGNYRLLHVAQMVITLSGGWKSHEDILWPPWFFALLGAFFKSRHSEIDTS